MTKGTDVTKKAKELATSGAKQTIFDVVERYSEGFGAALPDGMTKERFTRLAINAVKSNPKLAQCTPRSIIGTLMTSAQLGLEPNSPLGEASLIPRKNKQGVLEATFQPEYRGLLKLCWNSGLLLSLECETVHENDEFTYILGSKQEFEHKPNIKTDRGKPFAVYAYAILKGGGFVSVVKSLDECEAHGKQFSQTYSYGPWKTNFIAMCKKTVLKELADKKLPKRTTNEAVAIQKAIQTDEKTINLTKNPFSEDIASPEDCEIEASYEEVNEDTGEVLK